MDFFSSSGVLLEEGFPFLQLVFSFHFFQVGAGTGFSTGSSLGGTTFSTFGFNVFSRSILPTSLTSGFLISVLISTVDLTPEESFTRTLSSFSESSVSIFSEKSPIETDSFFPVEIFKNEFFRLLFYADICTVLFYKQNISFMRKFSIWVGIKIKPFLCRNSTIVDIPTLNSRAALLNLVTLISSVINMPCLFKTSKTLIVNSLYLFFIQIRL